MMIATRFDDCCQPVFLVEIRPLSINFKVMKKFTFLLIMAFCSGIAAFGQGFTVVKSGPNLNVARYGHAAVNLPDGKVLVIGGHTSGFYITPTAEIYDPVADTWTLYNITNPHDMLGMAQLADGRWLFMGGCSYGSGVGQSNVTTIYDPATNTFSSGPTMYRERTNTSAARLANGNVLVFGNWYSTGDAELYDAQGNYFAPAGAVFNQRSHAVVLPCADTTAVIFGGYTPFGGAGFTAVEMYNPSSGQFSAVSSEIFPGETGWTAAWNAMYSNTESMRLSNGNYVFLTYKSLPNSTVYRIGQFNPVTKVFSILETTPSIPDYDATSANPYAFWANFTVDPINDYIYINAYDAVSGNREERLYTVDAANGILSIPTGGTGYITYLGSGTKVLLNGQIMITGGTLDGSNFNVSNNVVFISPNNSFGSEEVIFPTHDALFVYPNPSATETFVVSLPNTECHLAQIFEINGRLVKQYSLTIGQDHLDVQRGDLPAGVYVVEVQHRYGTSVARVVLK
jgi:hypothetical protein